MSEEDKRAQPESDPAARAEGQSNGQPAGAGGQPNDESPSDAARAAGIDPAVDEAGEAPEAEVVADVGEIETLRNALSEAEARAEENWNQFLRARAEMENQRRRAEKDVASARQQSLEKLAGELLAVKDSLEMGVQAARSESADVEKLAEGSELTLRMFEQALDKFNIEAVSPQGERFDPAVHEAMAAQESSEAEPNTVLSVVQKGYRLGERLLRPAMVIVAKAPAQSGGDHADADKGEGNEGG
ncbi:nucleotide exchange factor GrpE [Spiribacter pallidus]|jgi:molecular chaperone GrpE|uniref:nucleotide exchange factor GrpE n=1 Tax=Spiribacter pallidus TaxID=1987936 RepID=UPI00349FF638